MTEALHELLMREIAAPTPPDVARAAIALRDHFGAGVSAILFYGAALRAPQPGAVLDAYVLADDLRSVLPSMASRIAARLLPPNVYAIDAAGHDCKVAVIATADFARGMGAFAPHLWARFAQPVTLAYARDAAATDFVARCLERAVRTAVARGLPLMPEKFTAETLWSRLFAESYGAELRPEAQSARANDLVAAAATRYRAVTAAVLAPADTDGRHARPTRGGGRLSWALCRRWGKFLNLLRLMKAAFTYAGGLDYAVAKIARHSGVTVAVRDADRRWPLLGGIRIFLEARRKGGVR